MQQDELLLMSLTSTILDVLLLLQSLLFSDTEKTKIFASLPGQMAQKLTMTLLLWESRGAMSAATVGTGCRIRKTTAELILLTPTLVQHTLPWLIETLASVDVASESSEDFFSVLIRLVEGNTNTLQGALTPSTSHLNSLGTGVCQKLSFHPRPSSTEFRLVFFAVA